MGENQIRGGGVGGRSIRANAVASLIAKVRPLKRGEENSSEVGQKRISVEHESVQQTLGLRFVSAWLTMRCLLGRHFAPRHFGAAIWRFRYRDHVRFGHFRAEKGNEADNQQSTQASSAHDVSGYSGPFQIKPSLFDFDGLG
jgi:hypothetical protein